MGNGEQTVRPCLRQRSAQEDLHVDSQKMPDRINQAVLSRDGCSRGKRRAISVALCGSY